MRTSAGQVVLTVNWNGTPATATAEPALVKTSGAWVVVVLDAGGAGAVAVVEVEVEDGDLVAPVVVELGLADAREEFALGDVVVLQAAASTARVPMASTLIANEPMRPARPAGLRTGTGLTVAWSRREPNPSFERGADEPRTRGDRLLGRGPRRRRVARQEIAGRRRGRRRRALPGDADREHHRGGDADHGDERRPRAPLVVVPGADRGVSGLQGVVPGEEGGQRVDRFGEVHDGHNGGENADNCQDHNAKPFHGREYIDRGGGLPGILGPGPVAAPGRRRSSPGWVANP